MDKKIAYQIINSHPVEKLAKALSESGFKYAAIAFGDEKPLLSDNWEEHVYEIGEILSKNGISCIQTHAPYYDLLTSAEVRDQKFETAILRSVEATKMLGAELCAVHPRTCIIKDAPRETAADRKKSLDENIIAFTPTAELCEKRDVFLGIENLMKYPKAHPYFYSWIAEDHCELIDKLGSNKVAAVWDFGHANLVEEDHAGRIKKLGSRIKGTHVHNNGAREDDHLPPILLPSNAYYVDRSVNWESVLSALKSTGYDGYLTLETVINFDYPIEPYTKYLYESMCVLYEMMTSVEGDG